MIDNLFQFIENYATPITAISAVIGVFVAVITIFIPYIYKNINKPNLCVSTSGSNKALFTPILFTTLNKNGFSLKLDISNTGHSEATKVQLCLNKIFYQDSDNYNVGAQINFMQRNQSKDMDITEKKSDGYKIILRDIPVFGEKDKFELDSPNKVLYVSNYLNRMSGENLCREMNRWYRSSNRDGRYYPLINAQENNWHGNKEWSEQLSSFIKYLQETDQLFSKSDN